MLGDGAAMLPIPKGFTYGEEPSKACMDKIKVIAFKQFFASLGACAFCQRASILDP
jgi:hypothetical protein